MKLREIKIDNETGIGQVPNNANVDYLGLRVLMKPSQFLKLAHDVMVPRQSKEHIKAAIQGGAAIGAPFLNIDIPKKWQDNDMSIAAHVIGHEGRHRMMAVKELSGDIPLEVHLFFLGGIRNRHLKPEWIKNMQSRLIPQWVNIPLDGPWFEVMT